MDLGGHRPPTLICPTPVGSRQLAAGGRELPANLPPLAARLLAAYCLPPTPDCRLRTMSWRRQSGCTRSAAEEQRQGDRARETGARKVHCRVTHEGSPLDRSPEQAIEKIPGNRRHERHG